eukprot:7019479-Prymnesium_polylepis.1
MRAEDPAAAAHRPAVGLAPHPEGGAVVVLRDDACRAAVGVAWQRSKVAARDELALEGVVGRVARHGLVGREHRRQL